jgi:hypothetical protein
MRMGLSMHASRQARKGKPRRRVCSRRAAGARLIASPFAAIGLSATRGRSHRPKVLTGRGAHEKTNYIWVSEPVPFGVLMLSQVPLATYFQ